MKDYTPSGEKGPLYFGLSSLILIMSLLAGGGWGIVVGGLSYLLKRWEILAHPPWYILVLAGAAFLALPLWLAWIFNRLHISTINRGLCRSPRRARLQVILSTSLFYSSFALSLWLMHGRFHWLSGVDTLLLPTGYLLLWPVGALAEIAIVLGFPYYWAGRHASRPFCENCLKWYRDREYIIFGSSSRDQLLKNFEDKEWHKTPESLETPPDGDYISLWLALCPGCRHQRGAFGVLYEKVKEEDVEWEGEELAQAFLESDEYEDMREKIPSGNLHQFDILPFPSSNLGG